ncbi:hypothetical protein PsorP6_006983 [Peronosclerospora sorghi]|uniref:Uncharacterized protein n=1 Tax=Peronosclerospora sorghi TaxID=230839 RepID=A0ACC0WB08_9STRA|nr:hypothetical protein PsorP6_006983 [Peronosclerospora sorghi]
MYTHNVTDDARPIVQIEKRDTRMVRSRAESNEQQQEIGAGNATQAVTIVPLLVQVDDDAEPSEKRLEFECDWTPGIGGSIWTSGQVLVVHLQAQRAVYRPLFNGARVVELGSGTGYVGLMVAACYAASHVYLTDLETHLHGLRRNVERNAKAIRADVQVHVTELCWGSSEQETSLLEMTMDGTDAPQVDVILGTDVAYREELYDPLLHTINRLATWRTLILLGLNRADTKLKFFHKLEQTGFEYYKISESNLVRERWSREFGLFEIRRRSVS